MFDKLFMLYFHLNPQQKHKAYKAPIFDLALFIVMHCYMKTVG